jgi:putative transcriptional regulator
MRESMLNAVSETVQGLVNIGLPVSFTKRQLDELGVVVPDIEMPSTKVQHIRKVTKMSQNVFAKALNVSTHAVRQWEQGKRSPTGPTKVLLELLEKNPHLLDYRLS